MTWQKYGKKIIFMAYKNEDNLMMHYNELND